MSVRNSSGRLRKLVFDGGWPLLAIASSDCIIRSAGEGLRIARLSEAVVMVNRSAMMSRKLEGCRMKCLLYGILRPITIGHKVLYINTHCT